MKWWNQIFVFWMLNFQPGFSLSSFTFIRRVFSSSLISVHKSGVICISEVVDIFPSNLDSSLWFIQPGISHDVHPINGRSKDNKIPSVGNSFCGTYWTGTLGFSCTWTGTASFTLLCFPFADYRYRDFSASTNITAGSLQHTYTYTFISPGYLYVSSKFI